MRTTAQPELNDFPKDQVAVFTQDFVQIFSKARSIKASVREHAKLMEHPVESGTLITDHRIILQVEIELSLILSSVDYQDVYKSIRQYYLNSTFLVVQTKAAIYTNQIIESMPHEENPENYNALIVALKLKQVQIVTSQSGILPKNPANATTVDRGIQQGTTTDKPSSSAASLLFGNSGGT